MGQKCGGLNNWNEIVFDYQYYKYKSKYFTLDQDKFILYNTNKYGLDNMEKVSSTFKEDPAFIFDIYIQTRTPTELYKRLQSLLRMLFNENEKHEEPQKQQYFNSLCAMNDKDIKN